jgi:phospholipase C
MYVISPWSRGGWVNSQVFDHTSLAMFLERRFGIEVDSISPWHRAISGDLTTTFDFSAANTAALPPLPNMSNYAALDAAQKKLPSPAAPAVAQPLFQEPGVRPSRALPYVLNSTASIAGGGVSLTFTNSGTQGAVFHVYDQLHLNRIPRRYTVEAGKSLTDTWSSSADGGDYNLWVYGPNGFLRTYQGSAVDGGAVPPEIQVSYLPASSQLLIQVDDGGSDANGITVTPNNRFMGVGTQTLNATDGGTAQLKLSLAASGFWYDFTASSANFERRFAGRMETGQDGVSDPAMAVGI